MEQKLEETKKENSGEVTEYLEYIKSSVDDGSYFKDALNWYLFRYVTPICDRTLLIFGAIIAAVVLFFLVQMIQMAFPLVEKVPIFVRSQDQSIYFPSLVDLKPKKDQKNYDPNIATVDEAVLKYLLSNYVVNREAFDFSKAEIEDVNKKFNRIKNVSSDEEYRAFQLIMSKDNPASPINYFGLNVKKLVKIDSVQLIKEQPKDFANKAKVFLSNKIPTDAEIRFTVTDISAPSDAPEQVKRDSSRYIAKINFAFDGVKKDQKGTLNFMIKSYRLFKIE